MAESRSSNGLGIVSLVFGILALLICWFPFIGIPLAVLGLFLGGIGFLVAILVHKWEVGTSIAGIILSFIALLISLLFALAAAAVVVGIDQSLQKAGADLEEVGQALENAQTELIENTEQDQ